MKKIIIINGLVWAALILINSYLFKDHENRNQMFIIMISGFTIMNSFLLHQTKKMKQNHQNDKDC